jgi:UDP-N-acetyl-alpha-D-quinovosamine dehydrogenase
MAGTAAGKPADILVTGAGGALGRKIIRDLAAEGRSMRGAARGDAAGLPDGVRLFRVPDISGATDWSEALAGAGAVVHCAALTYLAEGSANQALDAFRTVNRDGTIALARQAAAAGARRFVFISSATVNGRSSGARPFRPSDPPAPPTAYSRTKLEAEQGLRQIAAETGLEVAIIRPPRILWPEITGNLARLKSLIERGLPLPFGRVSRNRRDNVSPDSLVGLVRACLDHPAAAGRTFLVSDGEPVSTRELILRLGRKAGRRPRLVPVPTALLRMMIAAMPARLLGRMSRKEMADELLGNLELDIAEARTLGWEPSSSVL